MHMRMDNHTKALGPALMSLVLDGCARGAPSLSLFGAYFPAWLLCFLLGILAAIGARIAFVAAGLANVLPYQLFVCVSIGVICGVLAWLLWFGH